MRQLRLVGPGEDGTVILEATDDAEQFSLVADDALRAACRPTPPPPARTEKDPVIELRPRDIQMRVRSGEDPQSIADEAGATLERVMRFAYPVLQERIRITDEARRARARRGSDGQLVPFGELTETRLGAHGVEPDGIAWDAFRREDGGWTVTAGFAVEDRTARATFSFALMNRTVSALNDVAADLLSERPIQALIKPVPPAPVVAHERDEPLPEFGPAPVRLAAVPDPNQPAEAGRPVPAGRPSRRQKAHTRPLPVGVDDELFDQEAFEPPASPSWHEPPLPLDLPESVRSGRTPAGPAAQPRQQSAAGSADPSSAQAEGSGDADGVAAAAAGEPVEPEVTAHRRTGRAADKPRMPSWDDILLGVRRKSE
jgi:hypothetical protein